MSKGKEKICELIDEDEWESFLNILMNLIFDLTVPLETMAVEEVIRISLGINSHVRDSGERNAIDDLEQTLSEAQGEDEDKRDSPKSNPTPLILRFVGQHMRT